ncbi:MAG TPA: choice-of-anchor Q domain-containing protein, partial [Pseudomonadota bacterium]|nr:choice-of-anchor Q domain-containing protein [Pseudomonadota bacterium]
GGGFGGGGGGGYPGGSGGFGGGGGGGGGNPDAPSQVATASVFGGGSGVGFGNDLSDAPIGAGGGGLGAGGVIFVHQGTVSIVNSTLTGNTAQGGGGKSQYKSHGGRALGGAIFNLNGTVSIFNSTLAYNTTRAGTNIAAATPELAQGGAVYNLTLGQGAPPATLHLGNSILSNSLSSGAILDLINDDQQGKTVTVLDSSGPNLVTDCNFCDDPVLVGNLRFVVKQDPLLDPLAKNGDATETLAPRAASQAIGRGEPSLCTGGVVGGVDQRNQERPPSCTLGAYESSPGSGAAATGCQLGQRTAAGPRALSGLLFAALGLLLLRRRRTC